MNPETAVAALPPVNWTLEILKLTVPPLLTALAVLVGAWVAYFFANRGRKEDILYKERFKGFEEAAGFLFEVKRICENDLNDHKVTGRARDIAYEFPEFADRILNAYPQILEKQPNRRHLVLLSSGTKTRYHATISLVESLIYISGEYRHTRQEEYTEQIELAFEDLHKILDSLQAILNETEATIESAFADLELPRTKLASHPNS